MRFVLVTGTSTGVGKTIVTAALACVFTQRGRAVSVIKPVQTGTSSGQQTDVAVIRRLSGCRNVHELVSLPDPLAPDTAARLAAVDLPAVAALARTCVERSSGSNLALVEGAGGVLVRLDAAGGTLLDLGNVLVDTGHHVEVVVVTTLALGTLNHTELTVRALAASGLPARGLIIGAEPPDLDLAERCNIDDLPRVTGLPILGSLPAGASAVAPTDFATRALGWLPSGW